MTTATPAAGSVKAAAPVKAAKAAASPPKKFHTVSDQRRAVEWLDGMIKKSGTTMTALPVSLTPELATVLLERNPENRNVKPDKVNDFVTDILSGNWKVNGEPLIISSDGKLNDGQHRCLAVIQSKTPITVMFVFGVDRDSRDTLDQGVNRSPGDYLAIHGYTDVAVLAAVSRMVWQWRKFGVISGGRRRMAPTRTELVHVAIQNPAIGKSIRFVDRASASRNFGSKSAIAFAHFAFRSISGDTNANYFMDALIDGADLKRTDPILYVRNRLIAERKLLSTAEKVELLFRAWNAHRLGEDRGKIPLSGTLPMLEA